MDGRMPGAKLIMVPTCSTPVTGDQHAHVAMFPQRLDPLTVAGISLQAVKRMQTRHTRPAALYHTATIPGQTMALARVVVLGECKSKHSPVYRAQQAPLIRGPSP